MNPASGLSVGLPNTTTSPSPANQEHRRVSGEDTSPDGKMQQHKSQSFLQIRRIKSGRLSRRKTAAYGSRPADGTHRTGTGRKTVLYPSELEPDAQHGCSPIDAGIIHRSIHTVLTAQCKCSIPCGKGKHPTVIDEIIQHGHDGEYSEIRTTATLFLVVTDFVHRPRRHPEIPDESIERQIEPIAERYIIIDGRPYEVAQYPVFINAFSQLFVVRLVSRPCIQYPRRKTDRQSVRSKIFKLRCKGHEVIRACVFSSERTFIRQYPCRIQPPRGLLSCNRRQKSGPQPSHTSPGQPPKSQNIFS